jgi:hypothetical protein
VESGDDVIFLGEYCDYRNGLSAAFPAFTSFSLACANTGGATVRGFF